MSVVVCGLDEAGRGPLAGPVTAACVILGDDFDVSILNDSKKLSEKRRLKIEEVIKDKAVAWSVAHVDHETIDKINILQASLLAMKNAFETLHTKDGSPYSGRIDEIVVDGLYVPDIAAAAGGNGAGGNEAGGNEAGGDGAGGGAKLYALVKADAKVPAVMASSILAKNARDRLMCEMAKKYPQYEYDKHKGYPTARHKELLHKYGPSPIQRKTFKY